MGTWGVHSFENDDALEWAAAYREMGLPVAASTIKVAISDHANSQLTADIACRAIAAVEAVADVLGRGSPESAERFAGAPEADPAEAQALVSEANELIMCVTGGSELAGLWGDADWGDKEKWQASLTDLRTRINGEETSPAAPGEGAEAVAPSDVDQLEDIRKAIGGLTHDVEVLRQEVAENFARIAKRVEELSR